MSGSHTSPGPDPRGSKRDASRDPPLAPRGFLDALPWIAGLLVATLTALITVALSANERRQLRESLEREAGTRAAAIETQVEARVDALGRMAARWEMRGGTPREEWEADADLLVTRDPAFAALEWIGPDLAARWIVSDDAAARGLDLAGDPRVLKVLERAAEGDRPIVSEPVELGGERHALLAAVPLRLDGRRAGFMLAVLPAEALVGAVAPESGDGRHTLALVHDGRLLFRAAPVQDDLRDRAAEHPVDLEGTGLAVRVWPTEARIAEALSALPFVVLGLGLVAALLLTLAMRSSALHRARSTEVQLANRALSNQVEERRRAMRALERTRDKLAAIVDAATEGIMMVDPDGRVALWNPVAERLFGPPADMERLAAGHDAYLPDGVTELGPEEFPLVRAFRGETVDDVLFRKMDDRHPEGLWIAMSARPLRERDGTPFGAVGVFRDVSAAVRAEDALADAHAELGSRAEALSRLRAELKRSNEELEQFTYVASHDLQEPLRTVASFTELLAERYRGKLGEEADEFIDFIIGGALRMQRQIRDLLAYSRLQSRGRPLGRVELESALDSALDRLSDLIETSGVVIERGPLPEVVGDYSQLVVVLENLIDNAVRFSRRAKPHPRVRIGAGWNDDEAVVWVADNGIGLDPRYADRIFGIFRRLSEAEGPEGTGIGLAICKRVVERHGGRIWVESKPGEGARFVLTLSVAPPSDERDLPSERAAAVQLAEGAPV